MAGYIIYSLDWQKFSAMVERPTESQLRTLAEVVVEIRDEFEGEFEADDPVLHWPADVPSLAPIVAQRLALADWYGDLSTEGKNLWEATISSGCMNRKELNVDFRVDSDGFYWDVIEVAWRALGIKPNGEGTAALAAFGQRPFRCFLPPARSFTDWHATHSMHPPEEVQRMLAELQSIRGAIVGSGNGDAIDQYDAELLPSMERIASDGRLLFVQVDT